MINLSSASANIMQAFNDRYERTLEEHNWKEVCLADALRAVADQVAPSDADEPRNYLPMAIECQRIRAELLAIADELEGITYGTYRCDLKT